MRESLCDGLSLYRHIGDCGNSPQSAPACRCDPAHTFIINILCRRLNWPNGGQQFCLQGRGAAHKAYRSPRHAQCTGQSRIAPVKRLSRICWSVWSCVQSGGCIVDIDRRQDTLVGPFPPFDEPDRASDTTQVHIIAPNSRSSHVGSSGFDHQIVSTRSALGK